VDPLGPPYSHGVRGINSVETRRDYENFHTRIFPLVCQGRRVLNSPFLNCDSMKALMRRPLGNNSSQSHSWAGLRYRILMVFVPSLSFDAGFRAQCVCGFQTWRDRPGYSFYIPVKFNAALVEHFASVKLSTLNP